MLKVKKLSKVYTIRFQRYKDMRIRVSAECSVHKKKKLKKNYNCLTTKTDKHVCKFKRSNLIKIK